MRTRTTQLAAAVGVLALTLTACGDDGNDDDATTTPTEEPAADDPAPADQGSMEETEPESMGPESMEPGTIVDVAASTAGFTTLVAAVEAAGLAETLSGEGPFTVFAPTDDAFAAALESLGLTADELLADTETLSSILTYHVIPGAVPSSDVVTLDGQSVATVNGAEVAISVDGDTVMVDDATVTTADVDASNGVIHVIDAVLLP